MGVWHAHQSDWVTFFVVSTGVALPGLFLLLWMIKTLPMDRQAGRGEKTMVIES